MERLNNIADLDSLINDLLQVARLAGLELARPDIEVEFGSAPHVRPKKLPSFKQAVYGFVVEGRCLKVGKAGPKSTARYASHHYNPKSSNSNLAKSLLNAADQLQGEVRDQVFQSVRTLTERDVGDWIERNAARFNLLVGPQFEEYEMALIEAFVQSRLRPIFEGKDRILNVAI